MKYNTTPVKMETPEEVRHAMSVTITDFVKNLGRILPNGGGDDLLGVSMIFGRMSEKVIMEHVEKYVMPYNEQINKRNLKFFKKNKKHIFKGVGEDKINEYSDFITGNKITKKNIDAIWDYFDSMVALYELHESMTDS